jgi:hypothetical protein
MDVRKCETDPNLHSLDRNFFGLIPILFNYVLNGVT